MADFLIDDIDDDMMSRIEATARMYGLSSEDWAREIIIALAENRAPDFGRATTSESSKEPTVL